MRAIGQNIGMLLYAFSVTRTVHCVGYSIYFAGTNYAISHGRANAAMVRNTTLARG